MTGLLGRFMPFLFCEGHELLGPFDNAWRFMQSKYDNIEDARAKFHAWAIANTAPPPRPADNTDTGLLQSDSSGSVGTRAL